MNNSKNSLSIVSRELVLNNRDSRQHSRSVPRNNSVKRNGRNSKLKNRKKSNNSAFLSKYDNCYSKSKEIKMSEGEVTRGFTNDIFRGSDRVSTTIVD